MATTTYILNVPTTYSTYHLYKEGRKLIVIVTCISLEVLTIILAKLPEWKDLHSAQQTCQIWRKAIHTIPSLQKLYFLAPEPATDGVGHEILGPRDGPRVIFAPSLDNTRLYLQWVNLEQGDTRSFFNRLEMQMLPKQFYLEMTNSMQPYTKYQNWPREKHLIGLAEVADKRLPEGKTALSIYLLRKALNNRTITLEFFYKGMITLRSSTYNQPSSWYGWPKPRTPHDILHPLVKRLGIQFEYVGYAGYVAYFTDSFSKSSWDHNGRGIDVLRYRTFLQQVRQLYKLSDKSWVTHQLFRPACKRLFFVYYRLSMERWRYRTKSYYYHEKGVTIGRLIRLAIHILINSLVLTMEMVELTRDDREKLGADIREANTIQGLIDS